MRPTGMPPCSRCRPIASSPAEARQPQFAQSGSPSNWHGVIRRSRSAEKHSIVCANTHSSGDRGGRAYTSSTGSSSCSFENRGRKRRKSAITRAVGRRQPLRRKFPLLRCIEADPDDACVRVPLPRPQELFEIPLAPRLLSCDSTVHGDLMLHDVLEDPVVRRGRATLVVLGLQAVNRHDNLEASQSGPLARDRAHGARDELCMNPARPGAAGSFPARGIARAAHHPRSKRAWAGAGR